MSAFLRRRMRGLLRTTFSAPNSTDAVSSIGAQSDERCDEAEEEEMLMMLNDNKRCRAAEGPSRASATVYKRILNGKNGQKLATPPEVYSGKTGLDLPTILIGQFSQEVKACHTGPEGGLTKVQPMRQRAIAKMVNLDDEEFSLSSMDEDDHYVNPNKRRQTAKKRAKAPLSRSHADSIEALGFGPEDGDGPTTSTLAHYDWNSWDEERAYGLSTSLYEKHPVTGVSAGNPIADVFGIVARENNAIIALADGVNWGEGARLAARCAIRGALDHLDAAIERGGFVSTNDVFHCLLGSFHAAHALILQEGGALTTLCVALVAPVRDSASSVLCVCNVGDSLCFVFNANIGVREVTLASHDIAQMRDMRDAGGALGPVDGRNPQLHNLTCSMTFVEDGDLVFITSDGISDNFDPVVGKFCVIKRPREDSSEKENTEQQQQGNNTGLPPKPPQFFHKTKSAPSTNGLLNFTPVPASLRPMMKRPAAILPCVDALERHELMLLRMSDVIPNGLGNHRLSREAQTSSSDFASKLSQMNGNSGEAFKGSPNSYRSVGSSSDGSNSYRRITTAELCRNLIQFSYQLSTAKRRTLEDPELYRTRTHSKTEERLRRKVIRDMIMEMPGKLDHASVVAYRIGRWPPSVETPPLRRRTANECNEEMELDGIFLGHQAEAAGRLHNEDMEERHYEKECHRTQSDCSIIPCPLPPQTRQRQQEYRVQQHANSYEEMELAMSATTSTCSTVRCEDDGFRQQEKQETHRPIVVKQIEGGKKRNQRHHERGSQARHTLGVDVSWLKRLVTSKHESQDQQQRTDEPMGRMQINGNTIRQGNKVPKRMQDSPRVGSIKKCSTKQETGLYSMPALNNEKLNGGVASFSLRKLKEFMRQQAPPAQLSGQQADASQNGELQLNRAHRVELRSNSVHSPLMPSKLNSMPNGTVLAPPTVPRMGLGQLMVAENNMTTTDGGGDELNDAHTLEDKQTLPAGQG